MITLLLLLLLLLEVALLIRGALEVVVPMVAVESLLCVGESMSNERSC